MAKVTGGTITIELTAKELEAVKEALRIADRYEYNDNWSLILADLESGE